MRAARNILHLGFKELHSLLRDPILMLLIGFALTVNIYTAATAMPETLHKAPIAIVDEDQSALSSRIRDAFYPPYFLPPVLIAAAEMDARMDAGLDTFALHIPAGFERDVLAGRDPGIQLNVDATRMSQAFIGSSYIQTIVAEEVNEYMRGHRAGAQPPPRSGAAGHPRRRKRRCVARARGTPPRRPRSGSQTRRIAATACARPARRPRCGRRGRKAPAPRRPRPRRAAPGGSAGRG